MVDPADFRSTFRKGTRAGDSLLVVHTRTDEDRGNRLVGFVVPKREIKSAVRRNRVKRKLRHIMRSRLDTIPEGGRVVVRANAQAYGRDSHELAIHLDSAMKRAWKRWDSR